MKQQPDGKLVSYTPAALDMYDVLATDMETVREMFSRELTSDLPLVNERIEQVGRFRGKMLRPGLVLLCGRSCGPIERRHHIVATVVEMLHIASLIHDDVLDQSQVRRRGATLNAIYGNETAVLAGDYLLSHIFRLCSYLEDRRWSSVIAQTANMVCEGEIMQVGHVRDWDLSEQEYLQIISRKTASLCGSSCRLGVECSNGPTDLAQSMDDYGCSLGMAFQITDDLLDMTGSEGVVGKTLGRDITQGKLTLPAIRTRDSLSRVARKEFMDLVRQGRPENIGQICRMMDDCGALDSVSGTAQTYIGKAMDRLSILRDGPERQALHKIAQFVGERQI